MYKNRKIPILKRLVPSVRKHAARFVWRGNQGVVRREGAAFLLNLRYTVDRFILLNGIDETEQRAYFFAAVQKMKCDTFIDIGANIGTYTLLASLQGVCGTIISYEPNPRCYERLRINLHLNDLTDKVSTHMAAVSDHKGTVPFVSSPNDNDLFSKVANDAAGGIAVPAIRIDDELTFTGRKIALKIDIEGHEMSALKGMTGLLRNNDCFLQIECWPENAQQVISFMAAEGYTLKHRIHEDHYFVKQ